MSITTAGRSVLDGSFWSARREASLNWLALGLLLAAWNATDNDAATTDAGTSDPATNDAAPSVHRRPDALRVYPYVSVRAANRVAADGRVDR